MKELDEVMKTLADGLRSLAVGISAVAAKVEDLAKEKKGPKPKAKKTAKPIGQAAPKPAKVAKKKAPARKAAAEPSGKSTASAMVYQVISESRDGASMAVLKEKTGFKDKMIANILYKLKKQNKIKSPKRGLYVKV
jgi:hypothetical protein